MPVYNGERYLAQTIESILAQTYSTWELFCLDDTSTDRSFDILQSYADHDTRIQVFQKANGGCVPPAWMYIIPKLDGEFTLYMSQDDLLEPNSLELLVHSQKVHDADAVCSKVYYYREGEPLAREGEATWDGTSVSGKEFFRLMLSHRVPGHIMTRTSIIKNVGMRYNAYNSDDITTTEWMAQCRRVSFSDAVFLYRQDNPQAITKGFGAKHYTELISYCDQLDIAQQYLADDTTLHTSMHNFYFECLYKRMINYNQHRTDYSCAERRKITRVFHSTWRRLHNGVSPVEKKYIIGKHSWLLWWVIVKMKTMRLNKLGIIQCFDFVDKIPF